MRVQPGRLVRWGIVVVVVAAVAGACTAPGGTPAKDPRPQEWAAQVRTWLADPAFVASLGATDEERAQAVDALEQFAAHPDEGFDPALFDKVSADNKAKSDAADQSTADAAAAATLAEGEARQKEVAGPLLGAPSFEDVKGQGRDATVDDAEESGAELVKKQGAAEATQAYADRMPGVLDSIDAGTAADDPLASTLAALGYDKSGGITSSGPCQGRQGTRPAPTIHNVPNHNLRPGTIFSPTQDTWVGATGPNRPVYSGALQTRVSNGQEQFLVEGHVIDTAIVDPVIGNTVAASNIDQFQVHVFLQVPGVAQPLEYWGGNGTVNTTAGFEVHFLCYAEDASLAPGDPITRGYFQAWLPVINSVDAFTLQEPGFQVRSSIADHYWMNSWTPYSFFWGGDQKTVHVGPQPYAHHDAVPAGIGATIDRGFLVDDNGQPDDDLESLATGPISSLVNSKISGLDGSDGWVGGNNFGWLYYHVNNANPGTTSLDLSVQPAPAPNGGNDDEHRFVADLQLTDVYLEGLIILVTGTPCYFHLKADAHLTVTGALDIGQSPSALTTDLTASLSGLNVHDQFWSPLPLACNLGYLVGSAVAEKKITTAVNNALADLPEKIANLVSQRADLADYVNHDVPVGTQGNGFVTGFAAFDHTCVPYQCNGVHAGDVALVSNGLEASGDLLVTDRKSASSTRRFPFSYKPTTSDPVSSLIRDHTTPAGAPFSAAAYVSSSTLNQLLRSLTEGGPPNKGIFDTSMITGAPFNMRAEVAPIFLKQSISNKTLGLYLPDLRFDTGGYERMAANLAVGLDVTYNTSTGTLDPATIGVSDVAAGLYLSTLRCSSLFWAVCTGVPQVLNSLANTLGNDILPQLTHNTISQVTLPSIAGMSVLWADLENIDGNLAAFLKVGAQHVTVTWTSSQGGQFHFLATPVNYQGQGPVTYHWVVTDDVDGALLDDVTNQNATYAIPISNVPVHGTLMNQTVNFQGQWQGSCMRMQRARSTVTATQGTTTSTGTITAFNLSIPLLTAPTQSQLQQLC